MLPELVLKYVLPRGMDRMHDANGGRFTQTECGYTAEQIIQTSGMISNAAVISEA